MGCSTPASPSIGAFVQRSSNRPIAMALAALVVAVFAAPAEAGEYSPELAATAEAVIEGLDALTARVDAGVASADTRMHAGWDTAVARAVDLASLNRLEAAIAEARVEAVAVLDPLVGRQSTGAVPAAITAALWDEDMNWVERRNHRDTLAAWQRFRDATDRALAVRDVLRDRLGLPSVAGLRVCPLEHPEPFRSDWGDARQWWRTHRGNDMNAAEGTRLVAMERGTVIQMGWHYLGGNGIYVLGDVTGDVYYYAHLSAYADGIEVGSPVEAGQVVGYVGDTGNSDVPHLHLGWMPEAGAVDLDLLTDAYPMLVELCL